jgi:valyl-tRNA synthetase
MPEISKTYTPAEVEERWQTRWNEAGCFIADPARVSPERPAYSIVIPPPNVTGILTLGHVLNNTIQDILCRRARMQGKEVLWLPGTDHAGIATQNVVEKNLRKAGEMKHRDELGREALVGKIWEWKDKYGGIIIQQLKKLGASCDWSRERFTMDEDYSRCVQRVFVDLYKKGAIYRGKRMVNWCPGSLTALSDEEVTMKPQNGLMFYFKVEVVEEPGTWLTIATTRPEVIPGDTAIAVNPNDERYAHLIGKHIRRPLPLENQAAIPIIPDEHVDFTFGTGVLKVTPAHDKADYEIYLRNEAQRPDYEEKLLEAIDGLSKPAAASFTSTYLPMLPPIDVMHPNGVLNDLAGADLAGLERFAARKRAAELLTENGFMVKEEPYQNNVGYSSVAAFLSAAASPVQPMVAKGQSQEENQVSRTSGSWMKPFACRIAASISETVDTYMIAVFSTGPDSQSTIELCPSFPDRENSTLPSPIDCWLMA